MRSTAGSRKFATALVLLLLLFASCDDPLQAPSAPPTILSVTVDPNPVNALAGVVTVRALGAAQARVIAVPDSGESIVTPFEEIRSDSTRIDVIGLRASTEYQIRTIVSSASGVTREGDMVLHTTGPLPPELPAISLRQSSAPEAGFTLVGITASTSPGKTYALIVDSEGAIRWYRRFDGPVTDFQKLPDGRFTAYSSLNGDDSRFYEMDRGGRVHRTYSAATVSQTGPHELRVSGDTHFLFGIEFKTLDLTLIGGMQQAQVRGLIVEGFRNDQPFFAWSTFDHFEVSEAASDINVTGSTVNPWHGNAIDVDTDGNLLVSFRNADVITKLDIASGSIFWRLGGERNEFTFINDPLNGFFHQHGIRRLPNGNIILFDNGNLHSPPVSRAVEYRLDEIAKTATMVWEFRGGPEYYSPALGFAHRQPNGNTVICFGIARRIVEVSPSGLVEWELSIDEPNHFPYRAFRVESLY